MLREPTVAGGASVRLQRHDVATGTWSEIDAGLNLRPDLLAVSGDGRYLGVEADAGFPCSRLWRGDTLSGAMHAVTPSATSLQTPGISDDGARVVLASNDDALDPPVADDNGSTDVYLAEVPSDTVFGDGCE